MFILKNLHIRDGFHFSEAHEVMDALCSVQSEHDTLCDLLRTELMTFVPS